MGFEVFESEPVDQLEAIKTVLDQVSRGELFLSPACVKELQEIVKGDSTKQVEI